jgi:hypothetical protein
MRITRDRIVNVLGGEAPKPQSVWEAQFDGFDKELRRMAALDWENIPDEDLWYYFHDLTYVELQPDLFRHLFPKCLRYWHETLFRNESVERGDSDFHRALVHGQIAEKMPSKTEREALYDFFRDAYLDRIEAERGFHYDQSDSGTSANAWILRFNSLGMVAPVIQRIWEPWWALDHPGKAVCAVMYSSGLVYLKGENPIYGVWTPEFGGGGPYLTEADTPIFHSAWRDDNLAFLRETISVNYIIHKLDQAALVLSDCPEAALARRVSVEARTRLDVIEIRIGDLLENLSRLPSDQDRWE